MSFNVISIGYGPLMSAILRLLNLDWRTIRLLLDLTVVRTRLFLCMVCDSDLCSVPTGSTIKKEQAYVLITLQTLYLLLFTVRNYLMSIHISTSFIFLLGMLRSLEKVRRVF